MTVMKVPVNRQNLIRFKRRIKLLRSSHDILEDRYEQLRSQLDNILLYYKREYEDLKDVLKKAYENLIKTFIKNGKGWINLYSNLCRAKFNYEIKEYSKFGVPLLDIEFLEEDNLKSLLNYGFSETGPSLEITRSLFIQVLKNICILAITNNVLLRISRELKKTRKKISALENHFIPNYNETINHIEFVLEENERYNIAIHKIIKDRMEGE